MRALLPLLFTALLACALTAAGEVRAQAELLAESASDFRRPHDLVLSPDGRFLYVADVGNHVVRVLDSETLETRGRIGADELYSPNDVALDGDGRLLVADTGNYRIAVFEVDGTWGRLVASWTGQAFRPEGVAGLTDGRVAATDTSGDAVLIMREGRIVSRHERPNGADRGFARPHDVAVAPDGRLVVVDSSNHRILLFGPDMALEQVMEGPGFDFREPKYVAFWPDGSMAVADEYNDAVKIFDPDRRLTATIGGEHGVPLALNQPEGVEVRGERLWIADTYNGRIVLLRLPRTR